MAKAEIDPQTVERFLIEKWGNISDVVPLPGGAWSTAFGFKSGGEAFVARFGQYGEDFAKDQMASEWARSHLPIPEVVELGDAFDGFFALSRRHFGDKLDELGRNRLSAAIEELMVSLRVLSDVELPAEGYGGWSAPSGDASYQTWAEFLTSVSERDDPRIEGWRERLFAVEEARTTFGRAQSLVEQLAPHCPTFRNVIHSDLLYGNVLVAPDNRISAIFDWGNSLAGDSLYDVAWLTFWAPWHPGIDPARVREIAISNFESTDVDERLRCYQLHIAMDSMQYQAFAGLQEDLLRTAEHTTLLL